MKEKGVEYQARWLVLEKATFESAKKVSKSLKTPISRLIDKMLKTWLKEVKSGNL